MKKVYLCLIAIAMLIIENSITNYISILGVTIDFILIYLTIISLYLDELQSGIIGGVIGLVKDIAIGGIFGANALIYFVICYMIGFFRKNIYKESKVTICILILATTMVSSLLNILLSVSIYSSLAPVKLIIRGMVILPILNSIVALILYKIFSKSILKLKED